MLRTRAAARLLGIHPITLNRWIHKGVIEAIRLPSGEYRISQEAIDLILLNGKLTAKKYRARKLDTGK